MAIQLNEVQGQSMVLLPSECLEQVMDELAEIKSMLANKSDNQSNWLESEQARAMLGVSPRTWQGIRDKRQLGFVQIGRKIYVNKADIEAYLQAHYITPKA